MCSRGFVSFIGWNLLQVGLILNWSLPILCLVAVMFLHQGSGGLSSCCVGASVHRWGIDCPEIRLAFSVGRGGGAAQTTHWVRGVKLGLGSHWGRRGCKYTNKRSFHTHLNRIRTLCLYVMASVLFGLEQIKLSHFSLLFSKLQDI